MSLVQTEGYSATVDIRLIVEGACFDVAQVGESELILSSATPAPPLRNARLVVTVDGEEFCYEIHLTRIDGVRVSFF